jgi:putative radical SAM enzyme (TIGR03279 family)
MSVPRVVAVAPGSPADRAGILPGDEFLALNGEAPRDVIRYRVLTDEAVVDLEVRRGGLERAVRVEKRAGEPLGAEVHSALFDRVRTCDNHCPFCFIYQLPKGMRKSLYLKDDDYRLSFLYGNFTTLTRFTEADFERVIDEGLGPLYVSIHATDPDVRTRLLRNRRGATSLRWLRLLLDAGVEIHGQVVVCPGVNDASVLEDTFLGVLDRYPELATVGIVPLGVSAHNTEPDMRVHAPGEAEAVVAACERWQARFLDVLGRRMVFAADEYYLMAGAPFPAFDEYEGFPQHENGIGMARMFEAEVGAALAGHPAADGVDLDGGADVPHRGGFFAWVDGAPADGYRSPRRTGAVSLAVDGELCSRKDSHGRSGSTEPAGRAEVALLTGEYGARVLAPMLPALSDAAGAEVRALPVPNRLFGGNIAVTGLMTGADLAPVLAESPAAWRYLLPDATLSRDVFLDGTSPLDLPRRVEAVATDGRALVAALRGPA